jgi:phosphoribosylformylglycinamidine synthase subunit PurQ / glutaminase
MKSKFGVVIFPGSNCDHDAYYALKKIMKADVTFLWHKDRDLQDSNVIILPGGFSYGDYLRCGAIARFSPIMNSVIEFANKGGIVVGICNGFQVLLEAGLLPGVMIKNKSLQFVCKDIYLTVNNKNTIFTNGIKTGNPLQIPVAHGDGNYVADDDTLKSLQDNNQIVFQYSSKEGNFADVFNPNGSTMNIAGIINKNGNVLGMMPHPERVCDPILGRTDGQMIFNSILSSLN